MAKLYTPNEISSKKMLPKKETINFLLNYSKALKCYKIGNKNIEIISN
jgi:hypothetical protein